MRHEKWVTVLSTLALLAGAADATAAVLLLRGEKASGPDFGYYDIRCYHYTPEKIKQATGAEVEEDLARSRVVLVMRSGTQATAVLFGNDAFREPLRRFLGNGGAIFFDYNTYRRADAFLKSIGVALLPWCHQSTHAYYKGQLTEDGQAIAERPNKLTGEFGSGYGGWTEVPDGMKVLARMDREPHAAVMLERPGIEGKGRILFTQLYGLNNREILAENPKNRLTFENLWTYLLGKSVKGEGPGETTRLTDPYALRTPACNPLYLTRAPELPWWDKAYSRRLPFVVGEPIGLRRRQAPVSIVVAGKPKAYAVVTYYGRQVPAQAAPLDGGKTEIVFQVDLHAYENKLFYVYVSDSELQQTRAEAPALTLGERDGFIEIANDAIRAKLWAQRPRLASLKLRSGGRGDAVSSYGEINYGSAMYLGSAWKPARVLERGPVRARILYLSDDGKRQARYTLFAGDRPHLTCTIRSSGKGPVAANRSSCWSPGGRLLSAFISYEASGGIKRIDWRASQQGVIHPMKIEGVRPAMKEGWYAIEDTDGEVAGECFDRDSISKLDIMRAHYTGIRIRLSGKSADGELNSIAVLARGDWQQVRREYLSFKNPLAVVRGQWQDCQALTVAKPNPKKDLFRIVYMGTTWFQPGMLGDMGDAAAATRIIGKVLEWGADVLRHRSGTKTPEYWGEVVRLSNIHGISIFGTPIDNPIPPEERRAIAAASVGGRPCPIAFREQHYQRLWTEYAKASAKHGGLDQTHVMDEYAYLCTCDKCRALYRKRYGGELPPATGGDLRDPNYANSMLFRMNVITELARDLSATIHSILPRTTVYSVVNLKGLNKLYRLSDLEEHSRYVDLGGVDLYNAYDYYRSVLMFTRGAFGNTKRVENCVGYASGKYLRRQLDLTTVYGASIFYFGMSTTLAEEPARVTRIAGPFFCWLKFSGYADLMSNMLPVRHVALLRDRNLLIESIKHGEADKETFVTERGLYALANLRNIQMDMVFSRFFEPEVLEGYKLLLVPDNKYLPEAFAKTIRQFAEKGGCVYVEGASSRANSSMAEICREGQTLATLEGFDILRRKLGAGAVLYTEGFLSERLPVDLELATAFKTLLLEQAQPAPVTAVCKNTSGLDHVLHTDGPRYLLNVINDSAVIRHTVDFSFNVSVTRPAVWVDMETGASRDFDGTLHCEIKPESARYFLITPKSAFRLPRAEAAEQGLSCYATHTGMQFLAAGPDDEADRPRKFPKIRGTINVGVFVHPKMTRDDPATLKGQLGVRDGLARATEDMVVRPIQDLEPATLNSFDVVVVPNVRKANPPAGWESNIRDYVVAGGGALLVHHAVGYGSGSSVMFPEIGRGVDFTPELNMRVVADHAVTTGRTLEHGLASLKVGAEFVSGFPDYITLAPGPSGQVLVQSLRGRSGQPEPVVVAGSVGKGKVVLCGMNIGCQGVKEEGQYKFVAEAAEEGERQILLNSVRWLAERESD